MRSTYLYRGVWRNSRGSTRGGRGSKMAKIRARNLRTLPYWHLPIIRSHQFLNLMNVCDRNNIIIWHWESMYKLQPLRIILFLLSHCYGVLIWHTLLSVSKCYFSCIACRRDLFVEGDVFKWLSSYQVWLASEIEDWICSGTKGK